MHDHSEDEVIVQDQDTTVIETTAMDPSRDANNDGINDCEDDGTCDDTVDYSQPRPISTVEISTDTETTISLADVANHNTPDDCWTTVDGNVYDVSSFVSQHPGGAEKISQVCGIDATVIFGRMHGSNDNAKAALASLQIGVLVSDSE